MWKLYKNENDEQVRIGYKYKDMTLTGMYPPHKPHSTGRVWVTSPTDEDGNQYYVGIIDCYYKWTGEGEPMYKNSSYYVEK
jgi:hypothetical protein